jgi:hypothetical protein
MRFMIVPPSEPNGARLGVYECVGEWLGIGPAEPDDLELSPYQPLRPSTLPDNLYTFRIRLTEPADDYPPGSTFVVHPDMMIVDAEHKKVLYLPSWVPADVTGEEFDISEAIRSAGAILADERVCNLGVFTVGTEATGEQRAIERLKPDALTLFWDSYDHEPDPGLRATLDFTMPPDIVVVHPILGTRLVVRARSLGVGGGVATDDERVRDYWVMLVPDHDMKLPHWMRGTDRNGTEVDHIQAGDVFALDPRSIVMDDQTEALLYNPSDHLDDLEAFCPTAYQWMQANPDWPFVPTKHVMERVGLADYCYDLRPGHERRPDRFLGFMVPERILSQMPSRALEEQVRLHRWLAAQPLLRSRGWKLAVGDGKLSTDAEAIARAFEQAAEQTEVAVPCYVSADPIRLISMAAESLTRWELRPEHLIFPSGFLFLASPITVHLAGDNDEVFAALSWLQSTDDSGQPGVTIISYTTRPDDLDGAPPIIPQGAMHWRIGSTLHFSEDGGLPTRGTAAAVRHAASMHTLRWFAAALAFMNQRLLVTATYHFNRAERRRIEQARVAHEPLVRVITLRAKQYTETRSPVGGQPVEWSCRWSVRGHWHKYHTNDGLEQRYLMPYIKGPDDKPLRLKRGPLIHVKD